MQIVDPDHRAVEAILAPDPIEALETRGLFTAHPGEVECVVDDPGNPRGLLVVTPWWLRVHAPDRDVLDPFIECFPDRPELGFAGVPTWMMPTLAERLGRDVGWKNECYLYYLPPGRLDPALITHDVRSLAPGHAPMVNDAWEMADAPGFIRECIEKGPSAVIFEGDQPVSWAGVYDDGQMGLMHTVPAARKKGYAVSITVALSQRLIQRGRTPFLFTLVENTPAQRLVERCGFQCHGEYSWFGIPMREPTAEERQQWEAEATGA